MSQLPDDELVRRWDLVLSATAAAHRRVLRRIEDSGVQGPWFAVLHRLLRADGHRLPMTRLAKDLSITSGGFTKLADRMARDGLIDRRGSSGDRRIVYATLTPAGLELARRLVADYQAAVREHIGEVLSREQLESLTASMQVLAAAHAADGESDADGESESDGESDSDDDSDEDELGRRGPVLPRR